MERKTIGFKGEVINQPSIEDLFGKWAFLSDKSGRNYFGKIVYVDNQQIGLLPYITRNYIGGIPLNYLKEDGSPQFFERNSLNYREETSEENIRASLDHFNLDLRVDFFEKQAKGFRLEGEVSQINPLSRICVVPESFRIHK